MYIFGIDMPIMEIIFLFGIFLFITLIIVWLEIRKFRKLILIERANIYRFGWDITKLKTKEKEKHSKTLSEFVTSALEKGFSKKEIKKVLVEKGWPEELVNGALNKK